MALLRRYHTALNAYDARTVAPMFAVDAVYVSPGVDGRIAGRDAIIAAFTRYFAEHPDQHAIDEVGGDGGHAPAGFLDPGLQFQGTHHRA